MSNLANGQYLTLDDNHTIQVSYINQHNSLSSICVFFLDISQCPTWLCSTFSHFLHNYKSLDYQQNEFEQVFNNRSSFQNNKQFDYLQQYSRQNICNIQTFNTRYKIEQLVYSHVTKLVEQSQTTSHQKTLNMLFFSMNTNNIVLNIAKISHNSA